MHTLARAVLAFVSGVAVLALSYGGVLAQQNIDTSNIDNESTLTSTQWWGGGMDTSHAGCGKCGLNAIAFHFFKKESKLRVGFTLKKTAIGYEAYNNGKRYVGDLDVDETAGADVVMNKDGSFYFQNKLTWQCGPVSNGSADCQRVTPENGFVVKFTIKKLPLGLGPKDWWPST